MTDETMVERVLAFFRVFCFGVIIGEGVLATMNQLANTTFNGGDRAAAGLMVGAALAILFGERKRGRPLK
jgi:hypothetical protein